MYKDERDLLDVLKAELSFLEKGGYGRSPRESWRQPLIFEDSPSCMNYDSKDHFEPCSECVLFQLVPPQFRAKQFPCRHIPFTAEGDTLDSLYRCSDQFEVENVFGNWLRKTIADLEEGRGALHAEGNPPSAPSGGEAKVAPLSQKLHPKCEPRVFRRVSLAGGRQVLPFSARVRGLALGEQRRSLASRNSRRRAFLALRPLFARLHSRI